MAARDVHRCLPPRVAALCAAALLAAGCAGDVDYFPLEGGRTWEYRITLSVLGELREQRLVVVDFGAVAHADGNARLRAQNGRAALYRRADDGIFRLAERAARGARWREDEAGHLVLPLPAEVGRSWTLASRLRLIESRTFAREDRLQPRRLPVALRYTVTAVDDTVSVPAGTFERCLRVEAHGRATVPVDRANATAEVEVAHTDWYAAGVGLVKSRRRETSDSVFLHEGEYLQELLRHAP